MFNQRGPRPKTQAQIDAQDANFQKILRLMNEGIPMSKACESL
jgi:hypothetical protein